MPAYLYILRSTTSARLYVGSCLDPDRRLREHNSGYVSATRNKGPWERLILVTFADSVTARRAEYFVKKQKSKRILQLICAGAFNWPDHLHPINCPGS